MAGLASFSGGVALQCTNEVVHKFLGVFTLDCYSRDSDSIHPAAALVKLSEMRVPTESDLKGTFSGEIREDLNGWTTWVRWQIRGVPYAVGFHRVCMMIDRIWRAFSVY